MRRAAPTVSTSSAATRKNDRRDETVFISRGSARVAVSNSDICYNFLVHLCAQLEALTFFRTSAARVWLSRDAYFANSTRAAITLSCSDSVRPTEQGRLKPRRASCSATGSATMFFEAWAGD